MNAGPPSLPEVERALDDVLSRPEFSHGNSPTLLERIGEWFVDLLNSFFSFLYENGQGLSIWGWVFVVALLAVLAYVCARLARRGGDRRRDGGRQARKAGAKPRTPEELLARADALAADGKTTQALVFLMRALLIWFQKVGALTLESGRTNRQYVYDLRRAGRPETGFFEAFCRDFNRFRYGGEAAGRSDYDHWRKTAGGTMAIDN